MRIGRLVGTVAVLVALAAGCGGDDGGGSGNEGDDASEAPEVTLEDWAEEADAICETAQEASDELEIEGPEDIAERGEEGVEIAEGALEDLRALDPPAGEDEEAATDLLDAIEEYVGFQEDLLEQAEDAERDEVALAAVVLDNARVIEDGLEAAEEADTAACADSFEEREEAIEALEGVFEGSGEFAAARIGDCLTDVQFGELAVVDCAGSEAQGEITASSLSGAECLGDERSVGAGVGITFCYERLPVSESEEDGFLEIGACIVLEDAGGDQIDVTEVACSDPTATHAVRDSVRRSQECPEGDRRFSKSDEERAETGPGEWCALEI